MPFIDVNGVSLRYELCGDGPVLVLIHEMGGSLDSWDEVAAALAVSYRILRYDLRGHGRSEKIRGSYAAEDAAADLLGLLDALGLSAPVAVAGCAVGATVALQFAAMVPLRVRALVAMAPAIGVRDEAKPWALGWAETIEREGMRRFVDEEMTPNAWPPALRSDPERFAAFRGGQIANDPTSFAATWRMLAGCRVGARLARIGCPVLLVAGRRDVMRSPAFVAALAPSFPDARVAVIDSGHFMAVQTPALVVEIMSAFLAAHASDVSGECRPASM
jgi:3-oxoadipate enol-lactonase